MARFCFRHDTCNRGILANSSLSAPSLPPLCGSLGAWSISLVCDAVNVAIWSDFEALHWSFFMVTRMIAKDDSCTFAATSAGAMS